MMKFSSTMTIQYDTIFSPFTAAQYPEALDWLRDSGFDAAEVCISHYRDLDVEGFKAELDRRGLACSNISTGQARTLEHITLLDDGAVSYTHLGNHPLRCVGRIPLQQG